MISPEDGKVEVGEDCLRTALTALIKALPDSLAPRAVAVTHRLTGGMFGAAAE